MLHSVKLWEHFQVHSVIHGTESQQVQVKDWEGESGIIIKVTGFLVGHLTSRHTAMRCDFDVIEVNEFLTFQNECLDSQYGGNKIKTVAPKRNAEKKLYIN